MSKIQSKITPFLWFDMNAEEAAQFYTSVFKNSSIGTVVRYDDSTPMPKGTVMTISFQLDGMEFTAINGGPMFKFTEAVSFVVHCENQEEVDYYWEKLTAGGIESRCGWLKDKFGLSWQVVPKGLIKILQTKNSEKIRLIMGAFMQMKKIDINVLQNILSNS